MTTGSITRAGAAFAEIEAPQRPRPVRLIPDAFEAFRVHSDKSLRPIAKAGTLGECVEAAASKLMHKDSFVVREGSTLHVFVVRQGKPTWRTGPDGYTPERWCRLYAEPVTSFNLEGEF